MENNELTKEGRASRAEYLRKWRASHKGKQAEYSTRYWNNKAATLSDPKDNQDNLKNN